MQIANRSIGEGHPVFIVAEMSCNHGGSLDRALRIIHAAAVAGADAIKFQTWMTPADLTVDSDDPRFALQVDPWKGWRLWDLYTETQTPLEWHERLFAAACDEGLVAFSSALSPEAVAFLYELGCPAYKIPSPELPYLDLIDAAAKTGKPVILSTGLAMWEEIDAAYDMAVKYTDVALLHCVSAYPAPREAMNLRRMEDLRYIAVPVGLSDHSPGHEAAVLAVALGASIIEKHLQFGDVVTPDSGFSLKPREFSHMVQAIREAEAMLAEPTIDAEANSQGFKRRLIGGRWLRAGPESVKLGGDDD